MFHTLKRIQVVFSTDENTTTAILTHVRQMFPSHTETSQLI